MLKRHVPVFGSLMMLVTPAAGQETGPLASGRPDSFVLPEVTVESASTAWPAISPDAVRSTVTQSSGEARPDRSLRATFFFGAGWPVGDMNVRFDPGFAAGARGEYTLSPMTRLGAQIGFHSFDHEPLPGTVDNEGVIDLSLLAKAVGSWGPYDPFALIGLGAFVTKDQVSDGRRWDGGIQMGGGLGMEVSEHLTVLVGTSFYLVFRGGENSDYLWIDGYLGFDFRQP